MSALTILKEEKEVQNEVEEENLPSALLQEKNQEIDHLSSEIQRLEQELENAKDTKVSMTSCQMHVASVATYRDIENVIVSVSNLSDKKAFEVALEDLRSQVEHLESEITRVRQDKEEEEERLHEVISTLQAELATLAPNLREVSDSQDGDSVNPSPAPSPEPHHYTIQELEGKGEPSSLKQELSLTHSSSSRSLRSRLKALQSQLETAVAEKEGLERLLLVQEEEYRGHGEEFGKRLKIEREKADELKGLLSLREAELEDVKTQVEEEKEKRKLSEEERDSCRTKAQEVNTLHGEKAHLHSLVVELQQREQDRVREIESLRTKEKDMKIEMDVLREGSYTVEKQIQEVRAEVVDLEELVADERAKIKTLETVKEELSAEREALRRREAQLQDEIETLRQEVASLKTLIQKLTHQLNEKESNHEEAQKEVLVSVGAVRDRCLLSAGYPVVLLEVFSFSVAVSSFRLRPMCWVFRG